MRASLLKPDTRLQSNLQKLRLLFFCADYLQSGLLLQFLRLAPELLPHQLAISLVGHEEDLKELSKLAARKAHLHASKLKDIHKSVDTIRSFP